MIRGFLREFMCCFDVAELGKLRNIAIFTCISYQTEYFRVFVPDRPNTPAHEAASENFIFIALFSMKSSDLSTHLCEDFKTSITSTYDGGLAGFSDPAACNLVQVAIAISELFRGLPGWKDACVYGLPHHRHLLTQTILPSQGQFGARLLERSFASILEVYEVPGTSFRYILSRPASEFGLMTPDQGKNIRRKCTGLSDDMFITSKP